jgi:hypothetical protein
LDQFRKKPKPEFEQVSVSKKPRLLEIISTNPLCSLEEILSITGKNEAATKAWLTMYQQRNLIVGLRWKGTGTTRYVTKQWYAEHRNIRIKSGVAS